MLKKVLLVLSLFVFTIAVTVPADGADARPRSFSSGKKSFNKTPPKAQDGVSKSSTTNKSSATGAASKPGFFGGGSFMKGMMIGGLAGLMFGGMFGSGFFGNMMGMLINVLAIVALIAVIMAVFNAFKRRRQTQPQNPNDNNRRW
ncbi:hypothetical protein [Cohnella abietis]|uniref:Preprotein translocase subunit Tim44 n=1 Tax=Cohnella abietis TaxID=2507935 RepID=A0A3T1D6A8_9BACL|nr:hypothetical protein [Cohnella abietis]BBI33617.1 hypothetical protein KCTCHS21_30160 [Cohnella abietis]